MLQKIADPAHGHLTIYHDVDRVPKVSMDRVFAPTIQAGAVIYSIRRRHHNILVDAAAIFPDLDENGSRVPNISTPRYRGPTGNCGDRDQGEQLYRDLQSHRVHRS